MCICARSAENFYVWRCFYSPDSDYLVSVVRFGRWSYRHLRTALHNALRVYTTVYRFWVLQGIPCKSKNPTETILCDTFARYSCNKLSGYDTSWSGRMTLC